MAKSMNQKAKILYLQRMLEHTGEYECLTMQQILDSLLEQGIQAERKSIYDDMETLRSFGVDVRYRRGKEGGYYVADRNAWKERDKDLQNKEKQMKLRCSDSIRSQVERYLGKEAVYVQKDDGVFLVTAPLMEGTDFYGWLCSLGREIHIVKPKKAARNYREYLKMIAREYKGS